MGEMLVGGEGTLRQGGWPEGTSQKTPALSEKTALLFLSLVPLRFFTERKRGAKGTLAVIPSRPGGSRKKKFSLTR